MNSPNRYESNRHINVFSHNYSGDDQNDEQTSVGNVMGHLAKAWGLSSLRRNVELKELWPEIVGEQIAKRSDPLVLKESELVVAVYEHIWAVELKSMSETIRRRCNEKLSDPIVKTVKIRLIDE